MPPIHWWELGGETLSWATVPRSNQPPPHPAGAQPTPSDDPGGRVVAVRTEASNKEKTHKSLESWPEAWTEPQTLGPH